MSRPVRGRYTQGPKVSYLGGFFLCGTCQAICIFDAESVTGVAAANNQAGVPACLWKQVKCVSSLR